MLQLDKTKLIFLLPSSFAIDITNKMAAAVSKLVNLVRLGVRIPANAHLLVVKTGYGGVLEVDHVLQKGQIQI